MLLNRLYTLFSPTLIMPISPTRGAASPAGQSSPTAAAPSVPSSVSLSTLSASSLLSELAASTAECERVDRELDELMAQRGDLERAISRAVPSFVEQIEALRRTHTGVSATVQSSAASAHALSSKVRDLDLSASNVQSALQRVESVLSLRHTIARVREKLAAGSLGNAGEELYKALFLQTPIEGDLSFLMLLELERKAREELQAQTLQRYVRQARNTEAAAASSGNRGSNAPQSTLESTPIFKLARTWPKLGCNYRGLVMHCAQVRHEVLAAINRSGWTVAAQVEGALIDYARHVGNIIDTCNGAIVQHLLAVQGTFGPGSQVRLVQELLSQVVDVEVASKLLGRFMDERKLREPSKGSNLPADDICSRIKRINQQIMAGASVQRTISSGPSGGGVGGLGGGTHTEMVPVTYYDPSDPLTNSPSSPLHIQRLDELLEELRTLAHDMEHFLKGVNSLARQSLDLLAEAANKEAEAREEKKKKQAEAAQPSGTSPAPNSSGGGDEAFARFLSNPLDLSALPSIHQQHDRVMTLLQKLLQQDKGKRNLLGLPTVDAPQGSTVFASVKPALAPDAVIPPAQLHLEAHSPFLLQGFGLDPNVATASQLYDVLLTLIGKYVLVEEYYMNVNVEKALAIDEHDGSAFAEDGTALGNGAHDDLESELEAAELRAKERERQAQAGGLHGLASAAMTSLHTAGGGGAGGGVDPYLYLTGMGGSLTGAGLPKKFVASFATHKTSTLVDNVCFIYKKCVQRSLKTSNRDAIYSTLLRVHENFNRKLRRIFEHSIAHYDARFGSKKKSSITYGLHANPSAYLFPQSSKGSGSNNLLGNWVSNAAGVSISGGTPSAQDVRRKVNADVSLLLTVNNLDSTIENMQALLRHIEATLEDMFGDELPSAQQNGAGGAGAPTAISSNYSRGLSLEQLRDKVGEFYSSFYAFDNLINRGLQMIADNCWLRLLPRLSLLQTHAVELYGCAELSSSAADQSDLILSGFIELFRRDVASLSPLLNENNFYQLVFKIARRTARFLESLVLPRSSSSSSANSAAGYNNNQTAGGDNSSSGGSTQPRILFTQSGGVQFDKQVRTLSSFFTNDVAAQLERHFASNFFLALQPAPVSSSGGMGAADSASSYASWRVSFSGAAQARALFSKLGHVGSILSVDRPSEVLDYTAAELFNLSKEEVRRILALRKEFSEREIAALRL